MPHVSKRKIPPKTQKKINASFVHFFSQIGEAHSDEFIGEFFTDTEKLMFAKRLAMIAMIDRKVSMYKISQELEVSESTVKRKYIALVRGKYSNIQQALRNKFLRKTLLDHLEAVIQPKFMPGIGKDRWQWLNEMYGTPPRNELKKKGYYKNK